MKIAIVVEGIPNSGKTSTFMGLVNKYSWKSLRRMRSGWQALYLNVSFKCLKIDVYFKNTSPSESKSLDKHFQSWTYFPEVLFVARQTNGQHAQNTLNWLNSHGYTIVTKTLSNSIGSGTWDRFDSSNRQMKLNARADLIMEDIKRLIGSNKII